MLPESLNVTLLAMAGRQFLIQLPLGGTASARAISGRHASRWLGARWKAIASVTHEFLQYAETLKTEPYICCNLGTGSWVEAQQWVEYCNSSQDTAMTRLRKQNGRSDPWKVTYWGLGNEMDGPWQMGHRSSEDYGKFALEAAKLMKFTDPSIKLIAAGSSNFGTGIDWIGWNRAVLDYLKNHVDYLAIHMYVGNRDNDYGDFLASSVGLDDRIKTTEGVD